MITVVTTQWRHCSWYENMTQWRHVSTNVIFFHRYQNNSREIWRFPLYYEIICSRLEFEGAVEVKLEGEIMW